MARGTIDIKLASSYDGKGTTEAENALRRLNGVVGVFGKSLGGLGAQMSRVVSDIFTGSLWSAGARILGLALSKLSGLWRGHNEEVEKATEAVKKFAEETNKAVSNIRSAYDENVSAVDKWLNRIEKQLDATKRLAVAEKELEKQRAQAKGDAAGAARAQFEIDAINAQTAQEKEAAYAQFYQKRMEIAAKAEERMASVADKAWSKVHALTEKRDKYLASPGRRGNRSVADNGTDTLWNHANQAALAWFETAQRSGGLTGYSGNVDALVRRYRDGLFASMRKKYIESDEGKADAKAMNAAYEAAQNAQKSLEKQRELIENLKDEEARRLKNQEAGIIENEAKQIAADQAAAAERDRLDRELHKKRMDDLRAEIAAQKTAAASLKATSVAAQSEFDRAFAMFRDPTRAAAEIGEEKAYANDLDRLHRTAARYGGKWRIDELSALMAAGDTQGVQSRLESWRKSRSFSPEVEAMVRASASERTKTTVEDELRKIEGNTAGLADKLDELLNMK
ncbi:MAG: hypothetical protein K6G94_09665 [Kiritimatiellae bacterium]|nr:hypothetical protein [Kiritimatiellia bacterium]